jgi:hypothetical protein
MASLIPKAKSFPAGGLADGVWAEGVWAGGVWAAAGSFSAIAADHFASGG